MTKRTFRCMIRSICAVILCTLFAGCDQRDLCYDHSHGISISIHFDWSLAPEANPSTMVVWAFPTDGSKGSRFEFLDCRNNPDHEIKLPAGSYKMICHNGDTEFNNESGSTYYDYRLTTDEYSLLAPLNRDGTAPRPTDTEDEPVRTPASHVYAHSSDEILTVVYEPSHNGAPAKNYHVEFTPCRATAIWNVRVENITNFTANLESSAIITGAAESYSFAAGGPSGRYVTVPFGLTACADGQCLKGSVAVFGDVDALCTHHLVVYTASKYYYDYDVSEQIHSAPDPLNVNIVVSGMVLPDSEGTGMSPGVSDWETGDDIEIPM